MTDKMGALLVTLALLGACSGDTGGSLIDLGASDRAGSDIGNNGDGSVSLPHRVTGSAVLVDKNTELSARLNDLSGCATDTVGACTHLLACATRSNATYQGSYSIKVPTFEYAIVPNDPAMRIASPLFTGGDTVSFKANGNLFTFNENLIAPHLVKITSPAHNGASTLQFTNGSPVDIVWQNGVAGETLRVVINGSPQESWFCDYDAGANHASVPANILNAAYNNQSEYISIYTLTAKDFAVNDWQVSLRTGYYADNTSNVSFYARFQLTQP